jgi:hypothetical protein
MEKGRKAIAPNPPPPAASVAGTSGATALPAPALMTTAPVFADLDNVIRFMPTSSRITSLLVPECQSTPNAMETLSGAQP